MENQNQKQKLYEFLPILTFIGIYFLIQAFDWMEATKIIIGVSISFITYIVMTSLLKEDKELNTSHTKQLNFQLGILSLFFLLIFLSGFLHWYRLISNVTRMGILLLLLLLYFIVLFRSMRILTVFKNTLEPKKT